MIEFSTGFCATATNTWGSTSQKSDTPVIVNTLKDEIESLKAKQEAQDKHQLELETKIAKLT